MLGKASMWCHSIWEYKYLLSFEERPHKQSNEYNLIWNLHKQLLIAEEISKNGVDNLRGLQYIPKTLRV